MKRTLQFQILIAVLSAGILFSSCGNVEIVKRKYRPGFHVEMTKKKQRPQVADATATADAREVQDLKTIETQPATQIETTADDLTLTAQTTDVAPLSPQQEKREKMKDVLNSPDFGELSFQRQMRTIQNKLFMPKAPASDTHWMAWVSFGTGIGASAFGLIGFIVAFFGVTLWPLAIALGVTAIVFAIIHKNKGYSGDKFRKLGLLFGIIGAGLGILGMIIWIIWVVGGFGGRYWYR